MNRTMMISVTLAAMTLFLAPGAMGAFSVADPSAPVITYDPATRTVTATFAVAGGSGGVGIQGTVSCNSFGPTSGCTSGSTCLCGSSVTVTQSASLGATGVFDSLAVDQNTGATFGIEVTWYAGVLHSTPIVIGNGGSFFIGDTGHAVGVVYLDSLLTVTNSVSS